MTRHPYGRPWLRAADSTGRGFTLTELVLALAMMSILAAVTIPTGLRMLDDQRARSAAAYLAHRLGRARIDAIRRSTFTGLRFEPMVEDYMFTAVADGNGNGLRTSDILGGIDTPLGPAEMLAWNFPSVTFGLLPGIPDADGSTAGGTDGVRVGVSRIVSMNPNGSATSGTLYLHGRRRGQYAVRVLGATGRVRTLKYVEGERRWSER